MMYLGNQAVGMATSLPVFADIAKIECGVYIPENDIEASPSGPYINHNLGEQPDFILLQADNLPISNAYTKKYITFMYISLTQSLVFHLLVKAIKANIAEIDQVSATLSNGQTYYNNWVTDSHFLIVGPNNNNYLKAGIRYNYVVGKFKEVTSNAS